MKTKLFVLIGLSIVVLTSMYFVSNVFAQTMTSGDLQITNNNAMVRSFTLRLADEIKKLGYTPIVEDRVMVSPELTGSLPGGAVHVPFVWYAIKITEMPDWPGEEINVAQASGNPNPVTYAAHIIATAPSESWCAGWRPNSNDISAFVGSRSVMTTAPGGIYPYYGVKAIRATGGASMGEFFQYLQYLPAEYSDMIQKFHTSYDNWTAGMPFPGAPTSAIPSRGMTAAEITKFMQDNPGYVNPYLIFTSDGVFGDPSTWTVQKHYWYDQTYASQDGSGRPESYSGVADARRNPFTDSLAQCTVSNPYNRIDSKGNLYSPFPSSPYYISDPVVTSLAKDALGFGEPYMAPDVLAGKLMVKAYPQYLASCSSVGGCAIGAYVRKAVHAYIVPKLPAYVPAPTSLPNGVSGPAETKAYFDAVSARQAYKKAADKVVVDAVQQIQLQMGSASDEGVAARAFISQWNKDPLPPIVTTPYIPPPTTPPSTVPGCSSAGAFSATTGKPCVTTSSEPGCTSAGPYSSTTGRLCGTSVVPGCIPGYLFSPLSGNSCSGGPQASIPIPPPTTSTANTSFGWYYRNFSYSSLDTELASLQSIDGTTCTGNETTTNCHPEWSVAGSLCNANNMSGACSPDRVNPYAAASLAQRAVAAGKAQGNTITCSAKYTPFRPTTDPNTGLSYYYDIKCDVNDTIGIDAKSIASIAVPPVTPAGGLVPCGWTATCATN